MKRIICLFLSSIMLISLYSCKAKESFDIVTTSYPSYDIANNIIKDKITLKMITPPGGDIHSFEPTSNEIIAIRESKLFIFTSYSIDTWINPKLISKLPNSINLSSYPIYNTSDMHWWTDPLNYVEMIDVVLDSVINLDLENANYYKNNANIYKEKILSLTTKMSTEFSIYESNQIYFAGHNSMESFGLRFNLEIKSLSYENKPDADLTYSQIQNLIDLIQFNNVRYLFIEELSDIKIAKTIQREIKKLKNYDLQFLELHGYHNLTREDFSNNVSYLDLLERNFNNIKIALGD